VVEQETADGAHLRVQKSSPLFTEKGGVFVITAVAAQPLRDPLHEIREQRLDMVWEPDCADSL
jgi:hypothetical protein